MKTVLVLLLLTIPAAAREFPNCAGRSAMLAHLAENYSETPVGRGLTGGGYVVELLRTPDGVTWTIIVTAPDGMTCGVAAGEAWESAPIIIDGSPA